MIPSCSVYHEHSSIIPTSQVLSPTLNLKLPAPVSNSDYLTSGTIFNNRSKIELGRLLFFDKLLSGNRNISCATCHHPFAGSGDDLSLSVGEGANGMGRDRNLGLGPNAVTQRIPRNAPPLFNLGAKEFTRLFHDGRLELKNGKFVSPAGNQLPGGLENLLAAQAMFPVTADHEMAGQRGENDVATAAAERRLGGIGGVWDILSKRIQRHAEYVALFQSAFPGEVRSSGDITFVQVANAIAAFEITAFRTDDSPFDQYLRGDRSALNDSATRGMHHFYGKAGCSICHSGKFQSNHRFHAIAIPQIGPGKGDGHLDKDDFGREQVTKTRVDRYKFRTPTLRNVVETGPWGHNGAYSTLEEIVLHHLDPVDKLYRYETRSAFFPRRPDLDATDFVIHNHSESRAAIARANELKPVYLAPNEVAEVIAFLNALTDRRVLVLQSEIPVTVPSGLPVSDYVSFPAPTGR